MLLRKFTNVYKMKKNNHKNHNLMFQDLTIMEIPQDLQLADRGIMTQNYRKVQAELQSTIDPLEIYTHLLKQLI